MLREVTIQDHGVEKGKLHGYLGLTVTSLTSPCPTSWIQTVNTWAEPAEPFRSPGTVYFRPNSVSSTRTTSPLAAIRRRSETKDRALPSSKPNAAKTLALNRPTAAGPPGPAPGGRPSAGSRGAACPTPRRPRRRASSLAPRLRSRSSGRLPRPGARAARADKAPVPRLRTALDVAPAPSPLSSSAKPGSPAPTRFAASASGWQAGGAGQASCPSSAPGRNGDGPDSCLPRLLDPHGQYRSRSRALPSSPVRRFARPRPSRTS